jgi:hypothetical protein
MDVEAVGGVVPSPRAPIQPVGVTAELADARAKLRKAVPSEHWQAVQEEVARLQYAEKMPPLTALQTVYAKLASGWLPHIPRLP